MKAIERIYQYIDYKKINKSDFEKKCGISNGYLGKMHQRNADIGESILVQIIEYCPDISPEWLIIGQGTMIKGEEAEIKTIDNEWLLHRFEEIVGENALLKKENEDLKNSQGKSTNPPAYAINSEKTGTHIAAEPI